MRQDSVQTAAELFPGDGEMLTAVRTKDWSATLPGPVSEWPAELRTAASSCLCSNFQMAICWGPGLVYLYNDAMIPIFGDKHPWALGQRVADAPGVRHRHGRPRPACRPRRHGRVAGANCGRLPRRARAGILLLGASPRAQLDGASRPFFDSVAGHLGTALRRQVAEVRHDLARAPRGTLVSARIPLVTKKGKS
jgi:hypothetical protein